MLGSPKIKQQQQEIERLTAENKGLKEEVKTLNRTIQTNETEHLKALDRLKEELKKIYDLFPAIREFLRIEKLCQLIGFSEAATKKLLVFKPNIPPPKWRSTRNERENSGSLLTV